VSTIGRTWQLWATRRENGALWNVGARPWVKLHGLKDPIVAVFVEEVLGDPYAPEVTHYAWEYHDKPERSPMMVQIRTGDSPKRAMMFLNMCFAYGVKAAIDRGEGKILALRITERNEEGKDV
jgi:hypothetical protein